MHRHRTTLFCLLQFSTFLTNSNAIEFQNIYIASVRCTGSDKFVYLNFSCFAKSYSRNFSTANVIGTAKMPLYNMIGDAKLLFRYGLIYREVIKMPKIDICDVTHRIGSNQTMANRVIFSTAKFLKDSYPQLVHECPYKGLDIRNATGNATGSIFTILPTGEYKVIFTGWIDKEVFGQITIVGSIKSSYRDTFG